MKTLVPLLAQCICYHVRKMQIRYVVNFLNGTCCSTVCSSPAYVCFLGVSSHILYTSHSSSQPLTVFWPVWSLAFSFCLVARLSMVALAVCVCARVFACVIWSRASNKGTRGRRSARGRGGGGGGGRTSMCDAPLKSPRAGFPVPAAEIQADPPRAAEIQAAPPRAAADPSPLPPSTFPATLSACRSE